LLGDVALCKEFRELHNQMTGIDPEVTSFERKSPGNGCGRPKSRVWMRLSSYVSVTRRRWQSR